jgi:transposase
MNRKVKQGKSIKLVAEFFGVSRQSVWYWKSETLNSNFKDLPRKTKPSKITIEVEIAILYMRLTLKWGTAKIQQGLMNLPDFMLNEMEVVVQNLSLSRTSINNVLKKHKINGYQKKYKKWKFFRAKYVNELWQVDLKEFKLDGKKYYIFVVIDDYSRYILSLALFDHCPTTKELTSVL